MRKKKAYVLHRIGNNTKVGGIPFITKQSSLNVMEDLLNSKISKLTFGVCVFLEVSVIVFVSLIYILK